MSRPLSRGIMGAFGGTAGAIDVACEARRRYGASAHAAEAVSQPRAPACKDMKAHLSVGQMSGRDCI